MVPGSPLVVIEFNTSTIRVCRSVVRRADRMITHCFSFGSAESEEETARLIAGQMKARRLKVENVILSLPRTIAANRLLRMPSRDKKEIASMVALRAQREFGPDKETEAVYDHQCAGFDAQGNALVSVFCAHKSRLMQYVRILKKSGIHPRRVTLNTEGLLRWSPAASKTAFLLNIDRDVLDFNVAFDGHSIFSRSLKFSRKDLAKEIKISFELCRRACGRELGAEGRLYVTGLTELLAPADLEGCVSRPVERLVLENTPCDTAVSYASVMGLALGTGQDGIDLTLPELRLRMTRGRERRLASRMTALLFSILLLPVSFLCLSIDQKIRQCETAKKELKVFLPVEKELRLRRASAFLDAETLKDRPLLDIYASLYSLTPAPVFLTAVEIGKDQDVILEGFSMDTTKVLRYLEGLQKQPFLKNCRLDYREEPQKGSRGKVTFKITCRPKVH